MLNQFGTSFTLEGTAIAAKAPPAQINVFPISTPVQSFLAFVATILKPARFMFLGHRREKRNPLGFPLPLSILGSRHLRCLPPRPRIILFALPVSILQSFCDRIEFITCLSFPNIPCCIENPSTYFFISNLFDFKFYHSTHDKLLYLAASQSGTGNTPVCHKVPFLVPTLQRTFIISSAIMSL